MFKLQQEIETVVMTFDGLRQIELWVRYAILHNRKISFVYFLVHFLRKKHTGGRHRGSWTTSANYLISNRNVKKGFFLCNGYAEFKVARTLKRIFQPWKNSEFNIEKVFSLRPVVRQCKSIAKNSESLTCLNVSISDLKICDRQPADVTKLIAEFF